MNVFKLIAFTFKKFGCFHLGVKICTLFYGRYQLNNAAKMNQYF